MKILEKCILFLFLAFGAIMSMIFITFDNL